MILSHEHRFVFIKGVKVGGTSAEIALSQVCGPDDIVTPITAADERHRLGTAGEPRNYVTHLYPSWLRGRIERSYVDRVRSLSSGQLSSIKLPKSRFYNHMPISEVLAHVPEARDYELLFVERSPYAKILSLANWYGNEDAYMRGDRVEGSVQLAAARVDRLMDEGRITKVLNIGRYREPHGAIPGKPWKTQMLGREIEAFLERRGLPSVPVVDAKRGIQSDDVDPASVFRPDQIRIINELFAEEFAAFGWRMLKADCGVVTS